MENKEEEKPKMFVGFCRLAIVDSDGLGRKVKGCAIESPLHLEIGELNESVLSCHFPRNDTIEFLRMNNDDNEYLGGCLCIGPSLKADEHINPNKILCKLENANCKKMLCQSSAVQENSSVCIFKTKAVMPFVKNAYDKLLDVNIYTHEVKFQTRVVKLEVKIPEDMYKEWKEYYETVSKFEKDKEKDKNEKNDNDK